MTRWWHVTWTRAVRPVGRGPGQGRCPSSRRDGDWWAVPTRRPLLGTRGTAAPRFLSSALGNVCSHGLGTSSRPSSGPDPHEDRAEDESITGSSMAWTPGSWAQCPDPTGDRAVPGPARGPGAGPRGPPAPPRGPATRGRGEGRLLGTERYRQSARQSCPHVDEPTSTVHTDSRHAVGSPSPSHPSGLTSRTLPSLSPPPARCTRLSTGRWSPRLCPRLPCQGPPKAPDPPRPERILPMPLLAQWVGP